MNDKSHEIELRSEKVRNIIGQIPPRIIRTGISLLFFIVLILFLISYLFKFNYNIKTTATVKQDNASTYILLKIPANKINNIKTGNKVILNFDAIKNLQNKRVELQIQKIPDTIEISGNAGYFTALIEIKNKFMTTENQILKVLDHTEICAEIETEKTSLFSKIISPK